MTGVWAMTAPDLRGRSVTIVTLYRREGFVNLATAPIRASMLYP